ncbi:hypothetical protein L596_013586 [Steinernema carpocapsae]|uniref:DNA replication factor RFC1 C-terminal domain-containing protein n=1 Tax=Steinernema carpocapsae TaxID=34508 RepID=A0A4U5P0L5_STECR|nr:hypothetical protein L596_013586 [Steinernema carpocapsae]
MFGEQKKPVEKDALTHVLIMDEVDGMSGNEDRAGIAELIKLIKTSKVPIICICNDRQSPKMRSLVNHCFDLRFQRPRVEAIRARIMTIVHQEGIKGISKEQIDEITEASNAADDLERPNVQMWQRSHFQEGRQHKHCRSCETHHERRNEPQGEAGALLHGLQYPAAVRVRELPEHRIVDGETLEKAGAAEDESGDGGHRARGRCRGNDSERGRLEPPSDSGDALLRHPLAPHERPPPLDDQLSGVARKELQLQQTQAAHPAARIALLSQSDVTTMACDYIEPLQKAITMPLVQKEGEGVREVIDFYNHYTLTKEDAESINELATWPGQKAAKIETKVKSALTRALNKEHRLLPYAQEGVVEGRRLPMSESRV